jgi:acyl-CoA reductase-like NAD-dependent aldehyde dehydrogenase
MTEKSVDTKVAKAQKLCEWNKTFQQRADLLHGSHICEQKKTTLAKTITLEMGKLLAKQEKSI